jgi:hypothetical protein
MSATLDEREEQHEPLTLTGEQKMAVARAARAFQTYGDVKKVMPRIAKAIVSLRLTFEKDNRPDYRGETPQYRGAVASLYESAIPDADERETFKVAIRYWVGKEFAARVEKGELKKADLIAAGVMSEPKVQTPKERQGRRQRSAHSTGIMLDGVELSPPEVLVEAERIVAEHVANSSLGAVLALQSIGRELGPVVAVLRDNEKREKLPGRSLRGSIESLLTLSLDAAMLSGITVEDFVASWEAAKEAEHMEERLAA